MDIFSNLKQLMLIIQLIISMGLSIDSMEVDGYEQKIYTLNVASLDNVQLQQKLSTNQVFGFENLTSMAKSQPSHINEIAVNGMFYDNYGHPAGILIMDGELITSKSIGTPMFLLYEDGRVAIKDVSIDLFIEHNTIKYPVYEVNGSQPVGVFSLYTPWYGATNRIRTIHTAIVVKNSRVINTIQTENPYSTGQASGGLDEGNFLLSYLGTELSSKSSIDFVEGDPLRFLMESNVNLEGIDEGFQTGGWLVRDGKNVSKPYENYIGRTDSLQPRTAVGITEYNEVIIKVVDGRQAGVSLGVTGYQLAQLFIDENCITAAYLDGGASSTIVKKGTIMNVPSLGEEKKISHGLFFDRDYSKVLAK